MDLDLALDLDLDLDLDEDLNRGGPTDLNLNTGHGRELLTSDPFK